MSTPASDDPPHIVVIDGIPFRIYVPPPKTGSAGATAPYEVVILGRCAWEACGRVVSVTKRFCSDECRMAYHNQMRKWTDDILDSLKR